MQRIQVQTAQNVKIAYDLASIGDRIVAFLIDIILIGFLFMGFTFLMDFINIPLSTTVALIFIIPFMIYHLLFEIFFNGQSLGKMAMKIKVVMLDGSQPSIGAFIIRWMFRLLEITGTSGSVALVTILINGKGQRLGDIAAGTTVVKLQINVAVTRHELIKHEKSDYMVSFDKVEQLTDADIAVILESLKIFRNSGNRTPIEATEQKIKDLLSIESDLPSVKFLYTIVRDYNHLTSVME